MTEVYAERSLDYLESRKVELITLTPNLLAEGRLFTSQPASHRWVKTDKLLKAHDYNNGINRYRTKYPNVFTFSYNGSDCFLVGNGNHRVADALVRGFDIPSERDANFGQIDKQILTNPRLAQIRFAVYGIEGIWPFSEFLEKFAEQYKKQNYAQ